MSALAFHIHAQACWVWIKAFNHHLRSFISTVSQQHSWQQHTVQSSADAVRYICFSSQNQSTCSLTLKPHYIAWQWITALYSKINSIIVINSNMFNKLLAVGFLSNVPLRLINITSSKKWELSEGLLFFAQENPIPSSKKLLVANRIISFEDVTDQFSPR